MNNGNKTRIHAITAAAAAGAAYAALTVALAPISYGAIQLRISEALCILPFFMPCTVWGLFVGCLIANLLTGNVFDILFGSLAMLAAALLIARLGGRGNSPRNRVLACLAPVILNAVIVGAVITAAYEGVNFLQHPGAFAFNALTVGLGEAVVLFALGLPLMRWLPGRKFFRELVEKTNKR